MQKKVTFTHLIHFQECVQIDVFFNTQCISVDGRPNSSKGMRFQRKRTKCGWDP